MNQTGSDAMNCCMVAYTFYEADNRVRRYAETLARSGHRVDVVALKCDGHPRREMLKGVHIYRIQGRKINERTKWSYLFRLLRFMAGSFVFLSIMNFRRKYDLIHVHSVPDFEVFSAVLPKLTGSKIILDIHDIVPEFYASKFKVAEDSLIFKVLVLAERLSCAFADHVIIANHLWEKKITARSIRPEKCTPIINYPDERIFKKLNGKHDKDKIIFLYPGSLNWHQGLDLAINAFQKVIGRHDNVEFHIYGYGPEEENLRRMVRRLGLEGKVIFHGPVSLEEIALIMSSADVGVVPKRADGFGNEAFSTKTMEFMALGVPIIVAGTAVDRYYYDDDLVMFFDAGNSDDLSEKMLRMVEEPDLREALTRRSEAFISENIWSKKQKTYLDIIGKLVG